MAAALSMTQLTPVPSPTIILAAAATPLLPLPPTMPLDFSFSLNKRAAIGLTGSEPTVMVEIRDPNHPGAQCFEKAFDAKELIRSSIKDIKQLLYGSVSNVRPPKRSKVLLVLQDMPHVSYCVTEKDQVTVTLSLRRIAELPDHLLKNEVSGMLVHELTHGYQYNGRRSCAQGLVEGVADWVRIRSNLAASHWAINPNANWNVSYADTAYFLDYLSSKYDSGLVPRINAKLRNMYDEPTFWKELTGKSVDDLWAEYRDHLNSNKLS